MCSPPPAPAVSRRLCHLTASRHLPSIFERSSLLSTDQLDAAGATYYANDHSRYDGHPETICCSVEYPNAWYGRRARNNVSNYPDWVVTLIDLPHIGADGVLFCPHNAAFRSGTALQPGLAGFEAMYTDEVVGSQRTYTRTPQRIRASPTDDQAEGTAPAASSAHRPGRYRRQDREPSGCRTRSAEIAQP